MRSSRRKSRKMSITVEGVVALVEWSDAGDDSSVVILTDDDEEYYVDARDTAIRPAKFINARVEASGRLYERDGQIMLAVRRIRVLDDYGDASEEDFENDSFEGSEDYDFWADDGIVDQYARFVRGPEDFAD